MLRWADCSTVQGLTTLPTSHVQEKYIHCMAPLPGGLTPLISTPAVKEERTDLYPSRCFCFPFVWLASTNGMFVSVFSVSLQFRFLTRILLKFQFAYVKITHIASIWHNIQRTNWRCQYYILYSWIRHTTHRFGFTCLKIFILLIYSIFLVYTVSCHSQHDSFGHIDKCSVDCTRGHSQENLHREHGLQNWTDDKDGTSTYCSRFS